MPKTNKRARYAQISAAGWGERLKPGLPVNARWLETLGYFNIQFGYTLQMSTPIAFKPVY